MTNYRLARLNMMPATAMSPFYAEHPHLAAAGFAAHQRAILDSVILFSDALTRAVRDLGNEATEIFSNVLPLNAAWAREHGLGEPPSDPQHRGRYEFESVAGQLAAFRPDVLYVQALHTYPPGALRQLRERVPSLRLVIGHIGLPPTRDNVSGIDHLLVASPGFLADAARCGVPHGVVYYAFDEAIAAAMPPAAGAPVAFSFSGSYGIGDERYRRRYAHLVELALRTPIEMWLNEKRLDGLRRHWEPLAAAVDRYPRELREKAIRAAVAQAGPMLPLSRAFPDRCHAPVWGTAMMSLLRRSKITFNNHIDLVDGHLVNIRIFEATGVGSCLMVENGSNLRELFEPDSEIVTYDSVEDCVAKAEALLADPARAAAIAAAGQRRTLAQHTVSHRAAEIDAVIRKRLAEPCAA